MNYTKVDPQQIQNMIESGELKELVAVKDIPVKAIQLTQEKVDEMLSKGGYETVVIDDNGKPFVETTNKKINVGDFLVTNQIAGYDNSYIVPAEKFAKLYVSTEDKNVFSPVGNDRKVYLLPPDMNVVFEAPWGGDMKIRAGGVLVPDGEQFYGINPEEFKATHTVKMDANKENVINNMNNMRSPATENNNQLKLG